MNPNYPSFTVNLGSDLYVSSVCVQVQQLLRTEQPDHVTTVDLIARLQRQLDTIQSQIAGGNPDSTGSHVMPPGLTDHHPSINNQQRPFVHQTDQNVTDHQSSVPPAQPHPLAVTVPDNQAIQDGGGDGDQPTDDDDSKSVALSGMTKVNLIDKVRRQKQAYTKHIHQLETELSRLKTMDPNSCELLLEDVRYDDKGEFLAVAKGLGHSAWTNF